MLENSSRIDYGKLIYHHRTKKRMTQEELSKGICSISYLSKLENNKMEVNSDEVVLLIFERLNIDINDYRSEVKEIEQLLMNWYESIQLKNKTNATNYFEQLVTYFSDEKLQISLYYWFEIISLRYLVLINDNESCYQKLKKLNKMEKNFDPLQLVYLNYFSGIVKCKNHELIEGIELLINSEKDIKELNSTDQEIDYHLALTYSHINNIPLAMYHAKRAIEYFNEHSLYQRSLDCQLIMGINIARIGRFDEAKNCYHNIIKTASQLNAQGTLGRVYTNLGYLYQKTKDYKKSIEYFSKSLEFKMPRTKEYGNSINGLVQSFIQSGDIEQGLAWINKGIKLLPSSDGTNRIRLKKMELEITNSVNIYDYIENTAIPYFNNKGDVYNLCDCYEELGDYYSSIFQYKKSSYYYALCNTNRKKLNT
ncbi:helix-turn-helix transcriptional regulator [Rossellomorea sp. AcN35-11]|nr:helix-turn-helix transcriptional regulator [Rossellomorea aquimaris]WJV31499.1 helix-turn-helix transcriptional regulator [Rossellomorea sp. AcN35-11]